jgi:hypothetical protein
MTSRSRKFTHRALLQGVDVTMAQTGSVSVCREMGNPHWRLEVCHAFAGRFGDSIPS